MGVISPPFKGCGGRKPKQLIISLHWTNFSMWKGVRMGRSFLLVVVSRQEQNTHPAFLLNSPESCVRKRF